MRFLNTTRGYSATSPANAEHYCLDCRFRDWLDATGDLTATVTFRDADGKPVGDPDVVAADAQGRFRTSRALGAAHTAEIVIRDEWGDTSGAPVVVEG